MAQPRRIFKLSRYYREYVKKGSKFFVEGRLNTRNWEDKDTKKKRYKTEIVVFDISLLSGREDGAGGYSRSASGSSAASFDQRPPAGQDDAAQSAEISDDDIPF